MEMKYTFTFKEAGYFIRIVFNKICRYTDTIGFIIPLLAIKLVNVFCPLNLFWLLRIQQPLVTNIPQGQSLVIWVDRKTP
ncbi:hypothetical protein GZ77_05085 [Endozoicomonas montiporae]|uniref:Uncharacterized protein n=1 Tax=Endozoicomonas montiporae TaxID=1027273 RepID=A0A081NBR6_9GAMM|nr:hypothetical protein GZ77_05085 [Endozoicomonas montiporae]